MNKYKNNKIQIFLPLIIGISVVAGMLIAIWINNSIVSDGNSIFKPVQKNKLSLVIDYIVNEYVDEIDREELVEQIIPELLNNLDPHSVYIDSEEAVAMMEELEGEFDGIGVQFNIFRDTILIVNVIPNGPSEKTGLMSGDRIVEIDDSLVAGIGIKNEQVMRMLKGESETIVSIKIKRKGHNELIPFEIERGHIPLKSVDAAYMIDDKTGYIRISNFSRITHQQFVDAVFQMKATSKIENVIIDLRDNAGGFLNAATNIVDEFLPGSKLLVYTEGQARKRNTFFSTEKRSICQDLNVAVLINEFSASASEIVAGAIQDNDRGFILGRRSFGKGLVQEAITFNDGSLMRLTTARYYTPSGRSIQKKYDQGNEEYYYDLLNRYEQGEFMQKDSIEFNDSLVYYTIGGRKVYGGGGIMPDIFVPADTIGYTPLLGHVRANSYDYFYAIDFVDNNRSNLKQILTLDQLVLYLDNQNLMQKFYSHLSNKGLKVSEKDIKISGDNIKSSVYGYIARQHLGDNAFYMIINQQNTTVQKALEILNSNKSLFD